MRAVPKCKPRVSGKSRCLTAWDLVWLEGTIRLCVAHVAVLGFAARPNTVPGRHAFIGGGILLSPFREAPSSFHCLQVHGGPPKPTLNLFRRINPPVASLFRRVQWFPNSYPSNPRSDQALKAA